MRTSSSNIFQLVTFSSMEGMYISSIENVSRARPSGRMILDAVFSKSSASQFCDLGTDLILEDLNELVMSLTNLG